MKIKNERIKFNAVPVGRSFVTTKDGKRWRKTGPRAVIEIDEQGRGRTHAAIAFTTSTTGCRLL